MCPGIFHALDLRDFLENVFGLKQQQPLGRGGGWDWIGHRLAKCQKAPHTETLEGGLALFAKEIFIAS